MFEFHLGYEKIAPTTWVYLASLLIVALYFKFNRVWSMRNLDLVLLILLAPGLILVERGHSLQVSAQREAPVKREFPRSGVDGPEAAAPELTQLISLVDGPEIPFDPQSLSAPEPEPGDAESRASNRPLAETPRAIGGGAMAGGATISEALHRAQWTQFVGYIWLFSVGAIILVRMLLDPTMVRRPLLEPNLSIGGLIFVGCALLAFLTANVITGTPTVDDLEGARGADKLLARRSEEKSDTLTQRGPGYPLLHVLPSIATNLLVEKHEDLPQSERQHMSNVVTAKVMAVLGHLAIVIGIVVIGYRHFDNLKMGLGTATLYLLLPYTAQMTGRVYHVLPAALLVWAIVSYRRPWTAGMFLGLAVGVFYYPLFLLPLWLSFYWQRGLMRFLSGVGTSVALVVLSLVFTSESPSMFLDQLRQMFGIWWPKMDGLAGIWSLGWDPVYRLPILAACFALGGSFALWPAQKNLGTLLSCSAAIMLATQFWHGFEGGLYMAWYLPLVLLTVFRPNLEDRVALSVLGEGWFPRRLRPPRLLNQAA